jgi:CRP-like cAMP-binding protein
MIVIMFEDVEPRIVGIPKQDFTFTAAQTVFRRGDPVRQVYFVTSGAIHLVRHLPNGAPIVIQHGGPGTLLAEASLHSARYHCDAVAVTPAKAWALSKTQLLRRLDDDAELGVVLTRRLAAELQQARFHAELLSLKTVSLRLDAWREWHGKVPAKGEWNRLAAELGVSAEALYREMARRRSRLAGRVP